MEESLSLRVSSEDCIYGSVFISKKQYFRKFRQLFLIVVPTGKCLSSAVAKQQNHPVTQMGVRKSIQHLA